jgi:hypothetical protein
MALLKLIVDFGTLLIGAKSERLQRKPTTKFNSATIIKTTEFEIRSN